MMDCFVSCFRINPHNNQHFKVSHLVSYFPPWTWRSCVTNQLTFLCSAGLSGLVLPLHLSLCPGQLFAQNNHKCECVMLLYFTFVAVQVFFNVTSPFVFMMWSTSSPTWTGGQRLTRCTATLESFGLCSRTRSTEWSKALAHTLHCAWHRWEDGNMFQCINMQDYGQCQGWDWGVSSDSQNEEYGWELMISTTWRILWVLYYSKQNANNDIHFGGYSRMCVSLPCSNIKGFWVIMVWFPCSLQGAFPPWVRQSSQQVWYLLVQGTLY